MPSVSRGTTTDAVDLATAEVAGTLGVTNGGTGRNTSTTAYGLLAAGTTATGAQQTLASGGTSQFLVGGGASALPSWTTAGTGVLAALANDVDTSGGLATTDSLSGPTDYCKGVEDPTQSLGIVDVGDWLYWRPGLAVTITGVWGLDKDDSPAAHIQLQKCDPTCGTDMLSSDYTIDGTAYASTFVSGENVLASTDYILLHHVTTGGGVGTSEMVCVSYTIN